MNFILGGGIAGLIWSFYNKSGFIVSPEFGGQMKNNFNLGPRYLHDTEISRRFLKDLELPIRENKIKIGYLDEEGEWVSSPDLEYRQKYFMKSRKTNSLEGFDSSVMNSDINEFNILDVSFDEIISKIVSETPSDRLIKGFVSKVDRENKTIEINSSGVFATYDYTNLVSSMPIKHFSRVVNPSLEINTDFESYDMTYVYCKKEAFHFLSECNFDYVYDLRKNTPYHRITKEKEGYVLDFFGYISTEDLDLYKTIILEYKTLKDAQLISRNDVKDLDSIKFIGRYGTWDRKWKTEKVIEEAIKFNEQ